MGEPVSVDVPQGVAGSGEPGREAPGGGHVPASGTDQRVKRSVDGRRDRVDENG